MAPVLKNYIAGTFQEGRSESWAADVNPSDAGDVIALVPAGTVEDVAVAVRAADEALSNWGSRTGPARAEHVYRVRRLQTRRPNKVFILDTRRRNCIFSFRF